MKTEALELDRRRVLCGLAGAGLITAALAACGDGDSGDDDADNAAPSNSAEESERAGGDALAQVADVPVGGGVVVTAADGRKIVLVQPSANQIKAYDARCTHKGTTIGAPDAQGIMSCPAHGSKFKASDGSVARDPATSPLKTVKVKVDGENILLDE